MRCFTFKLYGKKGPRKEIVLAKTKDEAMSKLFSKEENHFIPVQLECSTELVIGYTLQA
ncbi:MAG: hypothetical protein PHS00_00850 [Candidatus Pacebacteria bacterium]|nr:hypothetical protein [Candidatus Paceibacterota bacterium]